VQVDHSDDEQVRQLFEQIDRQQDGQLDLLVNNVFSGGPALAKASGEPFWKHDPSFWDSVNNVGLRSHYVSSLFAARLMSQRQQGLILTISSWGGMSYLFSTLYGVGKAACDRLAADMAVELKSDNISSVSIWPGIVATEQISKLIQEGKADNPSLRDRFNWETPLFVGRAITAFAADSHSLRSTGKVKIVAELAKRYHIVDEQGDRPVSLRSLKFLLPYSIPALRKYHWLIPDLKVPWFVLLWRILPSPKL
jgi:NAD(P)-dependent dehydrogenase (short-subunit alcohol dehydrogenase family)